MLARTSSAALEWPFNRSHVGQDVDGDELILGLMAKGCSLCILSAGVGYSLPVCDTAFCQDFLTGLRFSQGPLLPTEQSAREHPHGPSSDVDMLRLTFLLELLRKIEDLFDVKAIHLVEFSCLPSAAVDPIDTLHPTSRLGHHPLMGGVVTRETGKQTQFLSFYQMQYSCTPAFAICDTAHLAG